MDPINLGVGGAGGGPGRVERKGAREVANQEGGPSFADALSSALTQAQDLQNKADTSVQKLYTGDGQDIHQVMVSFEQAKLSMQTLIEVRNKLVEAYQEISRMPI